VQDAVVADGTDDGVERLYREDGARLWRAVLAYGGDRAVASDAVAEAFAQLLRHGGSVRRARTWVWGAAFRIAAGELAHRARFSELVDTRAEGDPEALADPSGRLMTALRELSVKQRGSLILRHYAGYRVRHVARILGSTSPAVWVHLLQGRRRLRRLLEAGDG
jgi:DNA-directed RNA polymerase specialized sigma24 family protein